MASWHQQNAGLPQLNHPTQWRSYNPKGHLCIMTFASKEDCFKYCDKTGDVPLAPLKDFKGIL